VLAIQLIVGLCNPGKTYEGTRHNAGAFFIEEIARRCGAALTSESKFHGDTARVTFSGHDLRLLRPDTFMNRSGRSVAALANFYRIAPEAILIAHDELDMPPGSARFKQGGGHGGHNGLRDIIPALGGNREFHRLRVGIGHPGHAREVSDYVLAKPSKADRQAIDAIVDEAVASLPLLLDGDAVKAMTRLHSIDTAQPPAL
jgi:PTH1 family peptidyl-tRNA hydrolase